jgi:hypothetical protein
VGLKSGVAPVFSDFADADPGPGQTVEDRSSTERNGPLSKPAESAGEVA